MRTSTVERITKETQIRGKLKIEGKGKYTISTGIRFLDHMLELFTKHGGFDLELQATGDLDVDQHHTVEDVGIVLGQLFAKALGDRKGINRAGYFVMPMDETLSVTAIDLGGRPALVYNDKVKVRLVGDAGPSGAVGSSIAPRRHAVSHGAAHTRPQIDANGFGMAGVALADLLVMRRARRAAVIARNRAGHALHMAEHRLDAPEAAAGEIGRLGLDRARLGGHLVSLLGELQRHGVQAEP